MADCGPLEEEPRASRCVVISDPLGLVIAGIHCRQGRVSKQIRWSMLHRSRSACSLGLVPGPHDALGPVEPVRQCFDGVNLHGDVHEAHRGPLEKHHVQVHHAAVHGQPSGRHERHAHGDRRLRQGAGDFRVVLKLHGDDLAIQRRQQHAEGLVEPRGAASRLAAGHRVSLKMSQDSFQGCAEKRHEPLKPPNPQFWREKAFWTTSRRALSKRRLPIETARQLRMRHAHAAPLVQKKLEESAQSHKL
eukprot:scaffold703_cov245-Pinguiococcus_pyrenoidosus.AAC.19